MKSVFVLFVCFVAIVVATVLHTQKKNGYDIETSFDRLATAGAAFGKVLPANTRLAVNCVANDVYLFTRYLYANPYGVADSRNKNDTTINIFNAAAADSLVKATIAGKKVLWSGRDESNIYYLTCSQ
jgi:hypothetical protein